MMQAISLIMFSLGFFGIIAALYIYVKRDQGKIAAYRAALENAQKRLDQQTSRLNILGKALPGLSSVLTNPLTSENWQATVLDECRALLWADGAGFWRFTDMDGFLELQVSRGLEIQTSENKIRTDSTTSLLASVAIKRVSQISFSEEIVSEPQSLIVVPLVVAGELMGVFRFIRKGEDRFNSRDLTLTTMFINQLALAMENRDLSNNKEKFYLELIQTIAETIDQRDTSSQGQSKRARQLARGIAEELDLPQELIYYLEFAALIHDIGKIGIDDQLLRKPGKLTPEEFEIVKKHPELGYKILAPVRTLAPVAPMVLYHQERFDGKGYPEGLMGEEIPLGARIVAILDAWGAMTCDRPWRKALSKDEALREIKKGSGTQFDPRVVEAFVATIEKQGYTLEV